MSRRTLLALVLVALGGLPARAQMPFPRDLVPTRTSLEKLGLERAWMTAVPLVREERLLSISIADNLFFAQTSKGNFHAYEAETGRKLWSAHLGERTNRTVPASVNSFAVFVTNMQDLFALDRNTGRPYWKQLLSTEPTSSTTCDEDRVVVGLANGRLEGFGLKVVKDKVRKISDRGEILFNWQTNAPVHTRPMLATKFLAFGSDDGKLYVTMSDERTMLYRVATGGPIGRGLGAMGLRTLLVPSADNNLYAVDLFTSDILWVFPTGSPILQEPLVADKELFVVNKAGRLFSLSPENGAAQWITSTQGGRLLAISEKRVYLESHNDDLFIVDRETGKVIADPEATRNRIGLNLRYYDLGITNRLNDRLYFATTSGMVITLREEGRTTPRLVRNPQEIPFGTVPDEGVSLITKPAQPAEAEPAPEGEQPEANPNP